MLCYQRDILTGAVVTVTGQCNDRGADIAALHGDIVVVDILSKTDGGKSKNDGELLEVHVCGRW